MKRSVEPPIRFTLITLGILLAQAIVSAIFGLGPIPLAVTVGTLYISFAIFGLKTKDHTIWLWLLFGLVTGTVEVASDCDRFLCIEKEVLIYPDTFPKIGVSPAYLPFAWGLVFTQLGLISEWFRLRRSILASTLLTAALGGVLISVFENLARPAGWWYYQNTPMFIWAPYFVSAFEFLSTLLIVPAGWRIARASVREAYAWALGVGALMGIWMCVAMRFAFWLLGECEGAVIQLPCDRVPLADVWRAP